MATSLYNTDTPINLSLRLIANRLHLLQYVVVHNNNDKTTALFFHAQCEPGKVCEPSAFFQRKIVTLLDVSACPELLQIIPEEIQTFNRWRANSITPCACSLQKAVVFPQLTQHDMILDLLPDRPRVNHRVRN